MSRVRTPDRALRNRCFCGREAAGTAVFLRAAIEQRKNRKIRPEGCLHFSGLIFLFLCGESHDRDGAKRNRGALRNCGWKELEEGTNTNVQNLKGKMGLFPSGRSGCARRGYSQISFFKNNRHHIVCLSINRQSRVTLMVVSLL